LVLVLNREMDVKKTVIRLWGKLLMLNPTTTPHLEIEGAPRGSVSPLTNQDSWSIAISVPK
jgi:hypothetical protein